MMHNVRNVMPIVGKLWVYDKNGNFVESYFSRSCVRQGCVLGAFLSCLAMYQVYARP